MSAFERDGVAFNYLDEGDSSGRPFVFAGDAPSGDRAQWRELRAPALVLASWQDPTHPHSYAEILARELPSAQLAELTPKAEDEGRHAADARAAIAGFLGRVFPSAAAQEEATRKEAAGR
jgi:pimeloyl-ACP methyl ester carboxylesterase